MFVLSPPLFHIKLPHQTHTQISNLYKAKSQVRLQCNKYIVHKFSQEVFYGFTQFFPPYPDLLVKLLLGEGAARLWGEW